METDWQGFFLDAKIRASGEERAGDPIGRCGTANGFSLSLFMMLLAIRFSKRFCEALGAN
jgi:hypothetical protein